MALSGLGSSSRRPPWGGYTRLDAWNHVPWPLIEIPSREVCTLVVGLATIATEVSVEYARVMTISMLTLISLLVMFALFQPYFAEGLRPGYEKSALEWGQSWARE